MAKRANPDAGGDGPPVPDLIPDRPTLTKTETRIQFLDQAELEKLLDASYPDDAFGRCFHGIGVGQGLLQASQSFGKSLE